MTTLINHPITFEEFLKEGGNLHKWSDGYRLNFEVDGQLAECTISKESINDYDPRLLLIIEDMTSQFVGTFSIRRVYTKSLLWSLDHWENPMPITVRHYGDINLNAVDNILKYDPLDDYVSLMASIYYRVSRVGDLTYVEDVTRKQIDVPKTELDKYYPGWSLRYELMDNVAADKKVLMAAVFPCPTGKSALVNEPAFDAITFD